MPQFTQPNSIAAIKTSSPLLILLTHKPQPKTHFPKPSISVKWGKKRSGSQRSRKLILDSIAYVATHFKILPEPFDSLAKEFWAGYGGGNGGKIGFRNVFGSGGGGGGGGGEGRSRRREKLGFWVPLLISAGLAFWVVAVERERGSDLFKGLLVVTVFAVYSLVRGCWRREIKNWVLGFSCGATLMMMMMGLGLRNNENLVGWVDKVRASNPISMVITKKRRKGRRWV